MANKPKVLIVGLDGANWDLVEPWIESGELPNLRYLKENGSWGISISQLPTDGESRRNSPCDRFKV